MGIRLLRAVVSRSHPGQMRGSLRKKANKVAKRAEEDRAACAAGISFVKLRQQRQAELNQYLQAGQRAHAALKLAEARRREELAAMRQRELDSWRRSTSW